MAKNFEEYYTLRNEYASLFIFNEKDCFDLSIYLPVNDWQYSKIINENGEVMIGGKIHYLIDFESYTDYQKARGSVFTQTRSYFEEELINECGLVDNYEKRSFHITAGWDPKEKIVLFLMEAKSKGLFGTWKNLSTEYYCNKIRLSPQINEEEVFKTPELPSGTTWPAPEVSRNGDYKMWTRSFSIDRAEIMRVRR